MPGLKEILEALFFATDEPLTVKQVNEILEGLDPADRPRRVSEESILKAIEDLNKELEETNRAFRIVKVAGGYQFATLPKFAHWLGRMVKEKSKRKLSVPALESLAVIAYKQPVTKPEIEAIRGVNADYILRTLLERNLVTIVGRAATPGRPLLYGTTMEFLKHFGLNDLSELPKPREIDELLAEAEFEVEKRLLAEREAKNIAEDEEPATPIVDAPNPGNIVVGEDGTLREIEKGQTPGIDELSKDPE
ncbi:MAG: Segregation and condensation protein [Bacteroidetes bacterium]|nr:Segregation and condensation protein [Bacteroidota bacterium]